jgi:23S rRNA (guanosine2251-2'-O)-methyltransferase
MKGHMSVISGIHAVREALKNRRDLDAVVVAKGAAGPRIQEIIEMARDAGVRLRFEPRGHLDRAATTAAHQGVVAFAGSFPLAKLDDIGSDSRLAVALDGIEDPHNLGAIARTAHAAGASALILPERRSAGITDTALKAAAGALEYLTVVSVVNLNRALEELKERGFWIYGLDERGEHAYDRIEFIEPTVIVLGGEGRGLHQQVRKNCDALVRIPLAGQIPSLNVSVAAGIVLFEWKRRSSRVD